MLLFFEYGAMVVNQVVSHLISYGVVDFVVCAGARNLPIIELLQSQKKLTQWSHFEERSAGFFALGRTRATGEPCCVVTTSGTAVAELLPAVIEAHYQSRPLIILSADRPKNYRGSGAPQAIEQVDIFSDYVESSIDIEGEELDLNAWSGRRPLHINLCLEESPKVEITEYEIGDFIPTRERFQVGQLVNFLQNTWDGLVVALGGLEPEDREEVFYFLKDLGVPVVADATSGLREACAKNLVANPEKLIHSSMLGKVLRIGEVPVGRFWRDLENLKDIEVMSISRSSYSGLARESTLVTGQISRILKGVGKIDSIGDVSDLLKENTRDWGVVDELLERYPDSEPAMIRAASWYAAAGQAIYLGNSLPIREWNSFAQREIFMEYIYANRGANGIDGQVATWLGWAAELENSCAVLGDLTTLYDMAAFSLLEQVGKGGKVLIVVNNSGGKIFSRLERVKSMPQAVVDSITNAHQTGFSHLAAMWGMEYYKCPSSESIDWEFDDHAKLIELIPSESQTEEFWKHYKELL